MTESKALVLIFEMFIPGPQIAYLGSVAKDLGLWDKEKVQARGSMEKSLDIGVRRPAFWSHISDFNYPFLFIYLFI